MQGSSSSIYKDFWKEAGKLSNVCSSIGCPLCSSIAIALTRTTGKSVIIENSEATEDGETIRANFRLLERVESEEEGKYCLDWFMCLKKDKN